MNGAVAEILGPVAQEFSVIQNSAQMSTYEPLRLR
jgi:rRNA processing protein Gar1